MVLECWVRELCHGLFSQDFVSFKTFSVFAPSAISAARHGAQGAAKNTSGNTETGKNLARQRRGGTRAKTDKMERIHVTACCSMNPPLLITSIVVRSERMFVDNDQIMSDTDLQE